MHVSRKVVAVLAAAIVMGLATGTGYALTSNVATNWPATCTKVGCVDKHLNNLDARIRTLSSKIQAINSRLACVDHVNLTWYNKLVWNYYTNQEEWMYTLENTRYGDAVDLQVLYNACTPAAF